MMLVWTGNESTTPNGKPSPMLRSDVADSVVVGKVRVIGAESVDIIVD